MWGTTRRTWSSNNTNENMFALTSTWPKELDDKLVQSTEYCHFMLAFDSNNNKVKKLHLNTAKQDGIRGDRTSGERHFGPLLGERKHNTSSVNYTKTTTRIQFYHIGIHSSLSWGRRRHPAGPTEANLFPLSPFVAATMDDTEKS